MRSDHTGAPRTYSRWRCHQGLDGVPHLHVGLAFFIWEQKKYTWTPFLAGSVLTRDEVNLDEGIRAGIKGPVPEEVSVTSQDKGTLIQQENHR